MKPWILICHQIYVNDGYLKIDIRDALKNFNFLVKTKNVPKGLKCKINDNIFFLNNGFPKGGDGGPPLGKNSQIIP